MSTLSSHWVQNYYDLQEVLESAGLITVTSGTKTDTPTVTGTLSSVDPDGNLVVTITNYDSGNFYWTVSSGTSTSSGSDSYIWTAPSVVGEYDFSVYSITHDEVLSSAGIWSIEVVSAGPEWASYFDNTHWTPTTGSWDGSKWVSSGNTIDLLELGTWVEGFRPTKFRAYTSGMGSSVSIYAGATILYNSPMYMGGTEVTLNAFGVSDITRIVVNGANVWMSSLDFYG